MAKVNPTEVAAEIVVAFVSNNFLKMGELAAVIETVHAAVKRLQEFLAVDRGLPYDQVRIWLG